MIDVEEVTRVLAQDGEVRFVQLAIGEKIQVLGLTNDGVVYGWASHEPCGWVRWSMQVVNK